MEKVDESLRVRGTNVLVPSPPTELAYIRVAVVKRTVNVRKIQLSLAVVIFSYRVTIASQALCLTMQQVREREREKKSACRSL